MKNTMFPEYKKCKLSMKDARSMVVDKISIVSLIARK